MSFPSTMNTANTILIANRGEIVIRVARTCKAMGLSTVAVYSDADKFSEHARFCDRAVWIGGASAKDSYLNIEKIIEAAKRTGAGYIHPGYGFLSERPAFADACARAGIVFIGPRPETMRQMGDKIEARRVIEALGVPRIPGSLGAVNGADEAGRVAGKIGYPVLLKAAAGGGGKGMRRVDKASDLEVAFEGASREALAAFGDGTMYVEKLIQRPHHVEVQVFGDGEGGAIHLGERECSIQRRHQKVWEETPSPILEKHESTRAAMFDAAIKIAKSVKYAGAGTVEFIVDEEGDFYFLEMNTRLQVEHPVTEWVTGLDLVAMQIKLALGKLILPKTTPARCGHSIEVRLYAEDPNNFLPAPGQIGLLCFPTGGFVRADTAYFVPGEVSVHYDPMIAKISVWASDRAEAIARLRLALDEMRIEPKKKKDSSQIGSLKTNLSFLRRLVRHDNVLRGDTTTHLVEDHLELTAPLTNEPTQEMAIALAIFQSLDSSKRYLSGVEAGSNKASAWSLQARQEGLRS